MATYYIDLVNGNDANSGADWANAKKTVAGVTAAMLSPGDEVRIAKTMDETSLSQNATFTNGSITVTLTSAVTKDATEGLNGTWTVSPNVTAGTSTVRKHGASCATLAIAAGFTTGKIAYAAISGGGTQDFSAYQKLSFWFSTTATIAASTIKVCLCSDAIGDVIVDSFYVPATSALASGELVPFVVDKGAAMGASIQSIAIYADLDPGTTTIKLNNCFATNNLNLTSLIGKVNEVWWGVRSISGTTVLIDQAGVHDNTTGRGYYGTTSTETIYYRDPYYGTINANYFTVQDSGTASGGLITYTGGWNTGSNTRTGMTILEGYSSAYTKTGVLYGLTYNKVEYIGTVRFYNAFQGGSTYNQLNNCLGSVATYGFQIDSSYGIISNCVSVLSSFRNYGIANNNNVMVNIKGYSPISYNIYAFFSKLQIFTADFQNAGTADFVIEGSDDIGNGAVLCRHTKMGSTTEIIAAANRGMLWSFHHDQTTDNNWGLGYQCTINWQTAVFQGSDPGSWKVAILGSNRTTNMPVRIKLAEVAVSASSLVTFKAWVKKDHATNVGGKIYVLGSEYTIAGVVAASATKANDTNWEELTITFTPTQAGVVDIYGESWYSAGNSNVYFGSITVTQ